MLAELKPITFEMEHSAVTIADMSNIMRNWVERQPTLTPQNKTPPCYQPDGDGCAYQCYDGQDEPIDKCKECPLCYSDKQRHITPQNEWVSVKERLPEKRGEYIVCACDEGEPIDERIWGDTVVICADYYDGTFTWYEGTTEYDVSDIVTRWMPLPEPPDRRPPEGEEDYHA